MSIKPGYIAYFSVEVSVPKREGQYIGEIEMETDYEASEMNIFLLSTPYPSSPKVQGFFNPLDAHLTNIPDPQLRN